jgi:hypothetical protein
MTRGTIYYVSDKYIVSTLEFNGDMYPDDGGHGQTVMNFLSQSNSLKEFKRNVNQFNLNTFNYAEELFYPCKRSIYIDEKLTIDEIDMKDYFPKFFSDWTFWKNKSSKDIVFITREGEKIVLEPDEEVAINFGRIEGHYRGHTKKSK